MSTRLVLAIQEHYEQLSPSERKLATLLLDRIDDMLAYSAKEMADMAGVSKAPAPRLFPAFGPPSTSAPSPLSTARCSGEGGELRSGPLERTLCAGRRHGVSRQHVYRRDVRAESRDES